MARSTKTTAVPKPAEALRASTRAKPQASAPKTELELAPKKVAQPAPVTATPKAASARGGQPTAAAPVASARVPPPSKGELRAHIEKLEATNAALKAKSREANRTAKLAARRIAELEAQVEQLQAEAAEAVSPAPPVADAEPSRRGRPPGRKKAIDPGDAVPPGVAVQEAEPLDAEAEAARDALERNLL